MVTIKPKKDNNKCSCCGKSSNTLTVANSSLGAYSLAYCNECYKNQREPYFSIVNFVASIGYDNLNDGYKAWICNNLNFYKKSFADFLADVEDMSY